MKYSDGETAICIDCLTTHGSVKICVSDNGFGIPASELKSIFNSFYRSSSVVDKNIPGLGLGLRYSKLLLEAHGGSIHAKSEFGSGSTFTIEIPKR